MGVSIRARYSMWGNLIGCPRMVKKLLIRDNFTQAQHNVRKDDANENALCEEHMQPP